MGEEALDEGDFIKDESHLQQCLELIGPIPPHLITMGERSPDWFSGVAVDPASKTFVFEDVRQRPHRLK